MKLRNLVDNLSSIVSRHSLDDELDLEVLDRKTLIIYGCDGNVIKWEETIKRDGGLM